MANSSLINPRAGALVVSGKQHEVWWPQGGSPELAALCPGLLPAGLLWTSPLAEPPASFCLGSFSCLPG